MNSLPEALTDRLKEIYPQSFDAIIEGFQAQRIGSFRINTLKATAEEVLNEFAEKNIIPTPFEHIPNVYTFDSKDQYAIKGTQSFYEGKIYLQSIASLLPVLVLSPQKHTKILDICAAPGGKTTQIGAITEDRADIIALEKNKIRCDKLEYNCKLQGSTRVKTKKIDAISYLADKKTPLFDSILLDAPCSAEGRIHIPREKSYGFWTEENIQKKAELQYIFLNTAIKKLKKGGTLVYSTCTLAPEENEGVITRVLENHENIYLEKISLWEAPYFVPALQDFNGEDFHEDIQNTLRVIPTEHTEGFFIAKIVKN